MIVKKFKGGRSLKIAIVEDNEECRKTLQDYIDRFKEERNERIHCVTFNDGIDIVSEYTADYDVIFLDVVMKHMDGLKTAEYIRKMDKKVKIIFITSNEQYAIHGYSVEAFSFLLKPLTYFAFSQEFARCIEKVKSARVKYMVFSTDKGMDRVDIETISYVESQGHKMIIHTLTKPYYVYETIHGLENLLPKDQFSRCNHCYIVNLSHVTGVHGEYVVLADAELKISRARRKHFLEDLTNYLANE